MCTPMTHDSFRRYIKLLRRWGYQCVVCGRPFANVACVTVEHVNPRSIVGNRRRCDNQAPSHWRCNVVKGRGSLLEAAKKIDEIARLRDPKTFHAWLNRKVPKRPVPAYALLPVLDAEWFYSR